MNSSAAFLTSLGKRLSSMSLYGPGHPARDRAMDQVIEEVMIAMFRPPTRFLFSFKYIKTIVSIQ